MNLNLSLDLNVSEVVSPKGNADRQPLWGEEPVERDFEQLLQDKIESSQADETASTLFEEPELISVFVRQEVAAVNDAADFSASEITDAGNEMVSLPSDSEHSELLQLIANARSYEVTVEKNTVDLGAAVNVKAAPEAAQLQPLATTTETTVSAKSDVMLADLVKAVPADDALEPELESTQGKLLEQPQTASSKSAVLVPMPQSLMPQSLTPESQAAENLKRSEIEVPPVIELSVESGFELAQKSAKTASNQPLTTMQSAKAEISDANISAADIPDADTLEADIAKAVELLAAPNAKLPSQSSSQEPMVKLGQSDAAAKMPTSIVSAEVADAELVSQAKLALTDGDTLNTEDSVATKMTAPLAISASGLGQKSVQTPELQSNSAISAPLAKAEQHANVMSTVTVHQQAQSQSEVMPKAPLSTSQIVAITAEIAAGTQEVSPTPILNVNTAGSDTNQSFAEHQKQQNQQKAGQAALLKVEEHLQQPADAKTDSIRVGTTILESTLTNGAVQARAEFPSALHSTSAAPISALNHSAQAASQAVSQVAAQQTVLQTEKMATLSASLSLLEPNAAMQLKDRLMYQLNNKIQSAEVKITPEDLGTVQIKLNLQQEQLSVQFVVQQSNAKELLEQQMPKLKELLQQQGLQLTEGQVEQRQAQDRRSGGEEKSGQRGYAGTAEGEVELAHVATVNKQSDRMVDYYA